MRKTALLLAVMLLSSVQLSAQVDKKEVRSGSRKYKKQDYKSAELEFRKAQLKDSTSFAAAYDLGTVLYKQGDYEGAGKAFEKVGEQAALSGYGDRYFFNQGDVALQKKDYKSAVEAFKLSLLLNPGDMEAKESYIYAKKMLENQQNQNQNQDQNQDQDQDQNQDQNQDQKDNQQNQNQKDNQQDQDKDKDRQDQDKDRNQPQGGQPQEAKVSPQQAQQMLKAIQAKEKETQEKVNKEKAALLKSREKEKNW